MIKYGAQVIYKCKKCKRQIACGLNDNNHPDFFENKAKCKHEWERDFEQEQKYEAPLAS